MSSIPVFLLFCFVFSLVKEKIDRVIFTVKNDTGDKRIIESDFLI